MGKGIMSSVKRKKKLCSTFGTRLMEKACKCKKKHSPAPSILPKCKTPKEGYFYSLSFLSLSAGTAFEIAGEAEVEGGEAGWSFSMLARRLGNC
jgi:hypothetical protein